MTRQRATSASATCGSIGRGVTLTPPRHAEPQDPPCRRMIFWEQEAVLVRLEAVAPARSGKRHRREFQIHPRA